MLKESDGQICPEGRAVYGGKLRERARQGFDLISAKELFLTANQLQ